MKADNVIIILCDQLRKDWLGCYGHPSVRTPNLDALAASGLRCEHNIVASPICMPDRWSMLTGRHPRNHGCWTNGLLLDPLPATIADHAAAAGLRTVSIGKIHCTPTGAGEASWESRKRWRALQEAGEDAYAHTGPYLGFERVELTIGHGPSNAREAHYGQWFRERGGTDAMLALHQDPGVPESCGVRDIPIDLHHTTFVAERAEVWLRQQAARGERFLAHISFPDPHHPFDPPRAAADQVDPTAEPEAIPVADDLVDRPAHYRQHRDGQWSRKGPKDAAHYPGGIAAEHIRSMRARTTAMVEMIDAAIGRLLTALEETGLRQNTLIVFTADHGDGLGDHGMMGKGPWGYRSIIETPLLISGPGVRQGVSEAVISDVDLAPSICAALGLAPLPLADGLDCSAHWSQPDAATRDYALLEYRNGYGPKDYACAGLVSATETYIRYQDGVEELTDLAVDPLEHRNVAADSPERCQALRSRLLDHLLTTQNRGPEQVSHA